MAVTTDGSPEYPYGESPEFSGSVGRRRSGALRPPSVQWSPDSRWLLICRTDMRQVAQNYVLQYCAEETAGSIRPVLHSYRCPFAGEAIPMAELFLYDTLSRQLQKLELPPQPSYGILLNPRFSAVRWLADSSAFHFTWVSRGNQEARFYVVSNQGTVRCVIREKAEGFLNLDSFGQQDGFGAYRFSNFLTEDGRTVFWQSEREDLAHLYRYDAQTGSCLGRVTPGDSMAGKILAVEEAGEWIYYMGSNFPQSSDPYYEKLCRVHFDGSGFQILTPEDGMHRISMGEDFFVDTWSRVDLPPVTLLRRRDGMLVRELVKADITVLLDAGYVMPERFTVWAEDGTALYGILIKPAGWNPERKYPIVDYIYGGMQCFHVPKSFTWQGRQGREPLGGLQALAQAGVAGIILDGLGTPGRGRRIHQLSYQNVHGCAGLKDHVQALPQLQKQFPFLDIRRAGIWGSSGGGMAAARAMLEYPGVYCAAVASAGNHDQRMYDAAWTERYNGLYEETVYRAGDSTALAERLRGHLLIAHGAMDDNVPIAQSMRLADALIRADKDFDMLVLPSADHNLPADPYFIRKKTEYLLKHLL